MTNALLIIAPRKPERFDEAERLARRAGWNVARRTELRVDAEPRCDVVILDTIGELAQVYQVATVVFVGGSLVDAGGHNILEPAVFGKPIVFGPYMHNFAEIARTFLENGAAVQVRTARELEPALIELLGDPVRRATLGAGARALVEANRGARGQDPGGDRAAAAARQSRRRGPFIPFAGLVSHDRAATPCLARCMRRSRAAAASAMPRGRISAGGCGGPVISVGNLAVGGRGKTPLVASIVARAAGDGRAPRDPQSRLRAHAPG